VRGEIPKIIVSGETQGNTKSPGEVYIRKSHLAWLKSLLKNEKWSQCAAQAEAEAWIM